MQSHTITNHNTNRGRFYDCGTTFVETTVYSVIFDKYHPETKRSFKQKIYLIHNNRQVLPETI